MWIDNAFHTIGTLDGSTKLSQCLDAVEYLGHRFVPDFPFMVYKTPLPSLPDSLANSSGYV